MSDFDFDELDKAVNSTFGKHSSQQDAPEVDDKNANDPLASATQSTPSPEPGTTAPQNEKTDGNQQKSTDSIIKPRSSINRNPQAASKGGAVDIVAPSKKASRDGAALKPIARPAKRTGASSESPTEGDSLADPSHKPSTQRATHGDSTLRWPPKSDVKAADQTSAANQPDPTKIIIPPGHDKTAAAPADNDEGSLQRFDSLSRGSLDPTQETAPSLSEPAAEISKPATQSSPPTGKPLTPAEDPLSVDAKDEDAGPSDDKSEDTSTSPTDTSTEAAQQSAPAASVAPDGDKSKDDNPDDKQPEAPSNQSPFLDGTKVEKRPLGSYAASSGANENANSPTNNDRSPTSAVSSVAIDHLLADGHELAASQASGKSASANQPTGLNEPNQQYKPADHTDGATHPVFDTQEYHAPTSADTASKAGTGNWFLVISIIILVVAIAAAAGIYFYGNQIGLNLPLD